jgi:hypothetical protein
MDGSRLYDGELPEQVKENLIRGVQPHEKRVVINLANISRIVAPDDSIRLYDDFVSDWRYDRSEFLTTSYGNCYLCGKDHIREACYISDDVQAREVVVGNECVYKHIEIMTDGVEGLTGDEKKDYLKIKMGEAKDRFFKSKFDIDYGAKAIEYINGVIDNDWLYEKDTVGYAKRAFRMLTKKGYISHRTSTFEWFKEIDFDDANAERETQLKRFREMHSTADATYALTASRKSFEATKFRTMAERQADLGWLNPHQASRIGTVERGIRQYGVSGLRYGNKDFYDLLIENDMNCGPQANPADDIVASASFSDLNEWETNFVKQMQDRIQSGFKMSEKQQNLLTKIYVRVVD